MFIFLLFSTFLSLVSFIYFYQTNEPIAYFLMPNRFWEISSGSLLYLLQSKKNFLSINKINIPPIFVISAIFLIFLLPNAFAIFSTVSIVFLTLLLIVNLKNDSLVFQLITKKAVLDVGLLSYSLYLWHWGILSLSRWTVGLKWWTVPFQIVLIYLISKFSFNFIEQPLRKYKWSSKKWKTILKGIFSLVFAALSLIGLGKPLKGKLFLGEKQDLHNKKTCKKISNINNKNLNIVVGDSHASEVQDIVYLSIDKNCKRLISKSIIGNNFLHNTNIYKRKGDIAFQELHLLSTEKIIKEMQNNPPQSLIISSYWLSEFSPRNQHLKSYTAIIDKYYDVDGKEIEWFEAFYKYTLNLGKVAENINNTNIIIFLPFPEFDWVKNGGTLRNCKPSWFNFGNKYPVDIKDICEDYSNPQQQKIDEVRTRREFIVSQFIKFSKDKKNVFLFDPLPILCNDINCSTHKNNNIRLFRDSDHISEEAKKIISPYLKDFFEEVY